MDTPKPPEPGLLRRTFAGNFIDMQGLPVSLKILTIAGYLAVFGMLFFTLVVELAGDRLPTVEYTLAGQNVKVPLVVMAIAGLAFILGVNSRPMYTSHSRIDVYHQNECGWG